MSLAAIYLTVWVWCWVFLQDTGTTSSTKLQLFCNKSGFTQFPCEVRRHTLGSGCLKIDVAFIRRMETLPQYWTESRECAERIKGRKSDSLNQKELSMLYLMLMCCVPYQCQQLHTFPVDAFCAWQSALITSHQKAFVWAPCKRLFAVYKILPNAMSAWKGNSRWNGQAYNVWCNLCQFYLFLSSREWRSSSELFRKSRLRKIWAISCEQVFKNSEVPFTKSRDELWSDHFGMFFCTDALNLHRNNDRPANSFALVQLLDWHVHWADFDFQLQYQNNQNI